MIQRTFEISHEPAPLFRLVVEVGEKHIALITQNEENIPGKNFEYFNFTEEENFEKVLKEIKEQSFLFNKEYQQVKIVWSNAFAQCVPTAVSSEEIINAVHQSLENALGETRTFVDRNDTITLPYLANKAQYNTLQIYFPKATYTHKYLEIINRFVHFSSSEKLDVLAIFYQGYFIICVKQNKELQFINALEFSSGTDVVYHILNAAKQLNIDITSTRVILSGLIDGDSSLFKEIYKYIPIIDVDTAGNAPFLNSEFSEYPSHYFVPFFKYV